MLCWETILPQVAVSNWVIYVITKVEIDPDRSKWSILVVINVEIYRDQFSFAPLLDRSYAQNSTAEAKMYISGFMFSEGQIGDI